MRLLIENLTLLTGDLDQPLLQEMHLGIEGERIAFLLSATDPEAARRCADFAPERILSGRHRLGMPGLINTHTHVGMNLMRNYGSDLNLQDWLETRIFPTEAKLTAEDIHWASMLEMAEMILCGTTGFVDMYFYPEQGAQNVLQSGLRAKISQNLIDLRFTPGGKEYKNIFAEFKAFQQEWDLRENRLRVMALVHSTYLPPYQALQEMGEFIQANDVAVHTHMHETRREVEESLAQYGKRPIAIAAELGILTSRTIAAHCVHLDDSDRATLARLGVHAVHCPSSNLKLASGIIDLQAMLDAGVSLSFGTDGASSNNNLNMFEELHLAAILQKGAWLDPLLQPAVQMVHLATRSGAKALEMDPLLGQLIPGAPADIVLLDTDAPHWVPLNDPVAAAVYTAQGSDVDTVIVAGRILMENRELKTIDLEQAKWQVIRSAERLIG
ncbi:MAG: amidohydrolase [Symbiobacteriaceae bacterium]|nr:amidohydrolase [Symbiobacteriaceae bacterium]